MPSIAVEAAQKRVRCLELVNQGMRYDQVAEAVGYANKGNVSKAVWRAINEVTAEAVDEHRALELDRLDALQRALWDQAMAGDTKAVDSVLRIVERRCRLLGLDAPAEPSPAGRGGSLVDPSYWESLKAQGGTWPPTSTE